MLAAIALIALTNVVGMAPGLQPSRVYAAECGSFGDPQPGGTLSMQPVSGLVGASFSASGGMLPLAEGTYSLIWDWGMASSQALVSGIIPQGSSVIVMNASVPQGASVGPHNVAFCHQVQNELHHISGTMVFTVLAPPTATPSPTVTSTPTPTPPATATPVATSTPVPTTTATQGPATATSVPATATLVASATPVQATATAPVAVATSAPASTLAQPGGVTPTPTSAASPTAQAVVSATVAAAGAANTAVAGVPTATSVAATPTAAISTSTPTPTPVVVALVGLGSTDGGKEPRIFRAVPAPDDVDFSAGVVVTNVGLAGASLLLLFVTASVFNQTLSENQGEVERWAAGLLRPVRPIRDRLLALSEARTDLRTWGWAALVPVLTILVYGFLSPDFGFNTASVVTIAGLLVAGVVVTYLTEGLEAYLARSRYGQSTAVRIFPVAVLIAVVSVVLSRLTGFLPGVIYGFVGTAVYLRPSTLGEDESARTIATPAAVLLVASVACWLLLTPLREWSDGGAVFLPTLLAGIAVAIFIGGIEGLFFNMMPLRFMDGERLLRWNKGVWLVLAGASTLLFWQVLLNSHRSYYDGLKQGTTLVALLVMGGCFVLTIGFWAVFRWRQDRGEA